MVKTITFTLLSFFFLGNKSEAAYNSEKDVGFVSLFLATESQQLKDSTKVEEFLTTANSLLLDQKYKLAFHWASKAHDLSQDLNLKLNIAKSLHSMALIKFHQGLSAGENLKNSLYAQSHDYFLESLKSFERLGYIYLASKVSYHTGLLYKEWGSFHEKAINYFRKSLLLNANSDVEGMKKVLMEISNSYISLNDHLSAIAFQKELLQIFIQEGDDRRVLDLRRQISECYHEMKQFESALEEENQILFLKEKLNDSVGIVNSYNNLGFIHKHLKNYEQALSFFEKSLKETQKHNTSHQPTLMEKTVLMNIGIIYENMDDYQHSIKYFYNALQMWIVKGKPEEIAKIYKKIGQNHLELGDLEKARNSFRQALEVSKDSRDNQFVASLNKELSEIYQILGDDKNALVCYQLYAKANDAYLSDQNKQQELLLQQQYKITLAETDKRLAIAEKVIGEIELDKKRNENALLRQDRELLKRKEDLQQVLILKEKADRIKTKQELKIIEQQYELDKKDKEHKLLQQRDSIISLEVYKIALEEKQKAQELDLLKEKAYSQQLILDEQRTREGIFWGVFLALAIIVFLALRSYLIKRKANNILAKRNEEIQTQRDQLELSFYNLKQLSEIGKNITSNLSVERIIETVYHNVIPLMDSTVFGVGLFNENNNRIEFPGLKEKGETIIMISLPIDDLQQIAVKCFLEKKAIFINDFENDFKQFIQRIPASITGQHSSSIIYLPLIVKEKAIGVITVQSFNKNAYTEYHLNILRNLAVHTAIALENASNYGQIKDKTIKLEQTLKDLRAAQSQLVQSEKMASLGQLTAGIAHEINNPINFVYAGIDGLNTSLNALMEILTKYEEIENFKGVENVIEILNEINHLKQEVYYNETKSSINDLITAIKDGAQRTAEIVEGLRNFSRINETEIKKANIHKGIESSLVLLNSKITAKKITVTKHFDPFISELFCYPGQLNQVFMNLLGNAIDAIENTGKIEIITTNYSDHVKVVFNDDGMGMKKEIKDKIFDPFFTTKELGKGTGLGLSISFGIIEKHKGQLHVASKPGIGSSFSVTISKNLEKTHVYRKKVLAGHYS